MGREKLWVFDRIPQRDRSFSRNKNRMEFALGLGGGLGPELITNGDMSSATGWGILGTSVRISGGLAVFDGIAGSSLQQNVGASGKIYNFRFTIVSGVVPRIQLRSYDGNTTYVAGTTYPVGSYSLLVPFSGNGGLRITFLSDGSSLTADNFSLRQVL